MKLQVSSRSDLTTSKRDAPISNFLDSFKLIVATTPRLREEVYKIRYRVYCQELHYENEEKYPEGMERDIYDQRSVHCLLQHRASRVYAGCVRLVLPTTHSAEAKLPFERVLGDSWQLGSRELSNLSLQSNGEVSRLAVTTEFRKPQLSACSVFSLQERCYFPLLPLGLYAAATSVALEAGLNSVMALMEPRLVRHLERFGLKFHQMSELVDFHGQRGLFQIKREDVLNRMNANTRDLYQQFRLEVKKSVRYCPAFLRAA